jgi:outer membrane receptor protein involved in Fe transport
VFVSAGTAAGRVTIGQVLQLNTTVDYSATAIAPTWHGITPTTTVGFQYFRLGQELDTLTGIGFPTHNATSIGDAATRLGSSNEIVNATVGVFGQEEFAFNNRLFLTVALRADDNSSFGTNFKYVLYPKVSGSWVVSDEGFWHTMALSPFRLRFAYGQSGLQPQAFTALRTFEAITGPGGGSAVTPLAIGNSDLGPERSAEIEAGFEAGFIHQRISLDFTAYDKTTNHAIVLRGVAPSSGFAGQQYVNLGEIRNEGIEVALNAHIIQSRGFRWDATLNESSNANDVVSIGLPNTPYVQFGFGNRFQPGFPAYAFFARKVVSADRGADGLPTNIMCDGGLPNGRQGGKPVPCATAPDLYAGNTDPTYLGSGSTSFTIANRLTFSAMIDFKGGNKIWSSSQWCPGIVGCYAKVYPDRVSPVEAAHPILGYTDDVEWIKDISFAKLRELSLSYVLPATLTPRGLGVKQATLAVAARNLYTWTPYKGLDPENVSLFPSIASFGTIYEQNELPQLAQFVVKLNVTF